MAKKKKKKEPKGPPKALTCPLCGAPARLVTAGEMFGPGAIDPERRLWVCSRYGNGCDAYVYAQKGTMRPLGEMAGAEVRNLRIRAHRAIDGCVESGAMTKRDAYAYLADAMGLPQGKFHLAECGEYRCRETIRLMDEASERAWAKKRTEGERKK